MKLFRVSLALVVATFAIVTSSAGAQSQPSDALLKRMSQANAGLQSYTATTHVDIALHTFPYVAPPLDGNYYFKQPDKQAIVFNTVPIIAQQFQKVYPKLDPPSVWPNLYTVSVLSQDGASTMLRLVPRHHGRVQHLDVKVDNASAMPVAYTWTYEDGGSVAFDQQYAQVQGNYLIKSQAGRVDLPAYKADVTSTFSNFKLNVPIPDRVFEGS